MKSAGTETQPVAKTQKTFYLNDDLAQVVDTVATSTGASFTKIVTAALIENLLGGGGPPSPRWMRLATALERGDMTIADVLLQIHVHKVADAQDRLQKARKRNFGEGVTNTYLQHCDEDRSIRFGYTQKLKRSLEASDDPLKEILRIWKRMLEQRPKEPLQADTNDPE